MSAHSAGPDRGGRTEEPPPILRSWPRLYAVVLAWLALLIVLFYLFARAYSS